MSKIVVVAMSGGVDSAVTALLAQRAGYEVIGATLILEPSGVPTPENAAALSECCGRLGIRHFYLDRSGEFLERVLRPAAEEYARGRTPNPCCLCNPAIKFASLLEFAAGQGAEKLLTGHYVGQDESGLRRGVDQGKDQSYFLAMLPRPFLDRLHFPLGALCKSEVRRIAEDADFSFHRRADSQDVCFMGPGENCSEVLFRRCGMTGIGGNFLYQGKKVGMHGGIHLYTLGQRQGLGVALGVPAYVKRIDPETRDIELATDQDELLCSVFELKNFNWQRDPGKADAWQVQIRYRSRPVPCKVEFQGNSLRVTPEHPLRAVTPGQIGALYCGTSLYGGGVIHIDTERFRCC